MQAAEQFKPTPEASITAEAKDVTTVEEESEEDEVDESPWFQCDRLLRPVLRVGVFEVLKSQVFHRESDTHMLAEPLG